MNDWQTQPEAIHLLKEALAQIENLQHRLAGLTDKMACCQRREERAGERTVRCWSSLPFWEGPRRR